MRMKEDSNKYEIDKQKSYNNDKTFSIPFATKRSQETNLITKEEIKKKALQCHDQGNILEAGKYYKYLIDKNINE